jgi:uncharacterized protein (DUF952 family)
MAGLSQTRGDAPPDGLGLSGHHPDMTEETRAGRALHLTPRPTWEAWRDGPADAPFVAESLATEGFIHLTHEPDVLVGVANEFYREDARPYVVLSVDLGATGSPWRYDGDARFPHVYGPLDRSAIDGVRAYDRAADGTFLGIGEAMA